MKKIFVLLLITTLFSCNKVKNSHVPADIIPEDKMVEIIVDVSIAESAINIQQRRGIAANKNVKKYFDEVFKKHNVKKEDFQKSFKYYSRDPKEMKKIYTEVIEDLSRKQSEIGNK